LRISGRGISREELELKRVVENRSLPMKYNGEYMFTLLASAVTNCIEIKTAKITTYIIV
jgi:hypothetical protein